VFEKHGHVVLPGVVFYNTQDTRRLSGRNNEVH